MSNNKDQVVPKSVVIVEDDRPTRQRLTRAIGGHDELEVVAELGSLAEAREWLARGERCAAFLIDIGLPDGSGIELIHRLSAIADPPEIMVITVMGERRVVIEAIEAGASGYLLKDSALEDVGSAVLELLDGGSPISPAIARHLLRNMQEPRGEGPRLHLTERETEVLSLVAEGLTYEEIAATLGVSYHTVTTHTRHIYRKLSAKNRSEAVFEALRLGIIRISSS